ncbi:diacylglycerol/lipid kinase family protein [Allostreptomyces psammosilenae]|uniref:Diacylglycerol kinase (ATP) n=1 Tax=Allostreptomyces psammosilenae TaxID=1892865 RepID=A0A852ZTG8_9ACTN|nr:diacylglycerol kinase family protein [Allostreptomyces psammosilenae]NYI04837.1 diacylglycerol kinase (ATP) [Allostreptomyces psammosilenae]
MRILLVVNPRAGRGGAGRAARLATEALRRRGLGVRVTTTVPAVGELEATADAVVAVGGDGTVHHLLQRVAGSGLPLGLLPVGTGNDTARTLGVRVPRGGPGAMARAAEELAASLRGGRTRTVDLARADGRWYATILATGLDAAVARRARHMRFPPGSARYAAALAGRVRRLPAYTYRLEVDGRPWEFRGLLAAVGNGPVYGGGVRMCAGADLGDGLLDVAVVAPVSRRRLLRVAPRLYRGAHLSEPEVTVVRCRTVRIDAETPSGGWADGEPVGPLPLTVSAVPGALTVPLPPGAPAGLARLSR